MRARWLRMPWGRMRVWEQGDGPILLALHGLGGSGRYFRPLAASLAGRYRIVAPDLAGFGASDKPDAPYDRDFHLANLDALAGEVARDGGAITLVGHSLGGVLAAMWTARDATRVRGLAVAASPFPSGDGAHAWMRDGVAPPRARGRVTVLKALVPMLAFPMGIAQGYPAGVSLDYGRQRYAPRVRTLWSAVNDPAAVDAVRPISAYRAPALLAFARDDRSVGLDAQERWRQLLPDATVEVLEQGGHQFLLRGGTHVVADWLRALPR